MKLSSQNISEDRLSIALDSKHTVYSVVETGSDTSMMQNFYT